MASLDKFYTVPAVAEECLQDVGRYASWDSWDLVLEPSAGSGSFFHRIPSDKKVGLDIAPEGAGIEKRDFLTYEPPVAKRILVVGNPPFGRVSSMAIKFFNRAAQWATAIAFIVPRTFRRVSVQNKLDPTFHLVFDKEIPLKPCAFEPAMQAKCCFQIWERREGPLRTLMDLPLVHADFEFLAYGPNDDRGQPTPPEGADFAVRAYGGRCGAIESNADALATLRPKSWHWIRARRADLDPATLRRRFAALDYSICLDTARQNSIGRAELVRLYSEAFE